MDEKKNEKQLEQEVQELCVEKKGGAINVRKQSLRKKSRLRLCQRGVRAPGGKKEVPSGELRDADRQPSEDILPQIKRTGKRNRQVRGRMAPVILNRRGRLRERVGSGS